MHLCHLTLYELNNNNVCMILEGKAWAYNYKPWGFMYLPCIQYILVVFKCGSPNAVSTLSQSTYSKGVQT